jgi:hypothetical protein
LKKIVSAVLVLLVIAAAAGCGYRGNVGNSPAVSPYNYGYTASPYGTNNYNNAVVPYNRGTGGPVRNNVVTPGSGAPFYGPGSYGTGGR